jgi:hypothetical protein
LFCRRARIGVKFAHVFPKPYQDTNGQDDPMSAQSTQNWHPDEDVTPSPKDVENMACVLEGRHGQFAADVAEFFAAVHGQKNDAGRTWAWAGVAEVVRNRERIRLQG